MSTLTGSRLKTSNQPTPLFTPTQITGIELEKQKTTQATNDTAFPAKLRMPLQQPGCKTAGKYRHRVCAALPEKTLGAKNGDGTNCYDDSENDDDDSDDNESSEGDDNDDNERSGSDENDDNESSDCNDSDDDIYDDTWHTPNSSQKNNRTCHHYHQMAMSRIGKMITQLIKRRQQGACNVLLSNYRWQTREGAKHSTGYVSTYSVHSTHTHINTNSCRTI